MSIVVNDTNILIDLSEIGLLEELAKLNVDLHTIDLVINELEDSRQKAAVLALVNSDKLFVASLMPNDFQKIINIQTNNPGLSFEDCSVLQYAIITNGVLLTGDGKLRNVAKTN